MKREVLVCDLCGCEVKDNNDFFRVKVKSPSFITYMNHDCLGADKRTFDICIHCVLDFKQFIKYRKSDE